MSYLLSRFPNSPRSYKSFVSTRMASISDHYSARRMGQVSTAPKPSASTTQKDPSGQRPVGYQPSLTVKPTGRTYRPKQTPQIPSEEDPERASKKTRFSLVESDHIANVSGKDKQARTASKPAKDEDDAQRERDRVKRKLAIAKARRSSLATGGRTSLALPRTLVVTSKPNFRM